MKAALDEYDNLIWFSNVYRVSIFGIIVQTIQITMPDLQFMQLPRDVYYLVQ